MRRFSVTALVAMALWAPAGLAQQAPSTTGPYTVLKTAKVGGEGGWDYIFADAAGRRLYIPRGGSRAVPATDTAPAVPAVPGRITVFNLDTLAPIGEIPATGGQGVAVDPASGHGFSSSKPVSMFDTKTLTLIKTIDPGAAQPDGIYFDAFNERVYIFSHPTRDATVIDAKDGTVLGTIDLGGTPEQAVADGKGTLYVVMQDRPGSVAVVDVTTMKTTAHYPFGDNGGCNGLALDVKNKVLFAACSAVGPAPARGTPGQPPPPPPPPPPAGTPPPQTMVILSATDGKILAKLPLAGGSDGAVFNPSTMEALSTQGNGSLTVVKEKNPKSFEVEENLQTMNGARTITLDRNTNHIFTMSQEFTPPPPMPTPPPPGGRGGGRGTAVPGSFTILMIGK
jgi:DNA-binding beta-propeller fold protein YncE